MAQAKSSTTRGRSQQKKSEEASDKEQQQADPTVEDTKDEAAGAGQEQPAPEVDLDLLRFTGGGGKPAKTDEPAEAESSQVKQTGRTVEDTKGATVEAVVLVDVYSITNTDGSFATARKGDTVKTSAEAVERGARQGMLQRT